MTDNPICDVNGHPLVVDDLCFFTRSYSLAVVGMITGFKETTIQGYRAEFTEHRVTYRQFGEKKIRSIYPKKILALEPFFDLTMPSGADEKNIDRRTDITGRLLRRGHMFATVSRLRNTNVQLMMVQDFGPRGGVIQRPLSKDEYYKYGAGALLKNRRNASDSDSVYAGDSILVLNDSLKANLFRLKLVR